MAFFNFADANLNALTTEAQSKYLEDFFYYWGPFLYRSLKYVKIGTPRKLYTIHYINVVVVVYRCQWLITVFIKGGSDFESHIHLQNT